MTKRKQPKKQQFLQDETGKGKGGDDMANFTMVDQSTCIACGVCGELASNLFAYTNDGISYSMLDDNEGITEVSEDLIEDLEDAFDSCPTNSIKMSDTPFNCKKYEAS